MADGNSPRNIAVAGMLIALLGSAMTAIAYVHNTFVTKDYMELVVEDLKEIKEDLRTLLHRK